MLVSVIIPTFNSLKYIHQSIDSVINQSYKKIEIIVVDDGSTDNTLNELEKYTNIHVLTQQNKGACAARNFGYQQATGDFIQFLDADDILAPDKIELQLQHLLSFDDYSIKMIHSKWGRFYESIEEDIKWGPHEDIRRDLKPADWLIYDRMSMTGCWLTPRALIEVGGLWDESLKRNQDGEFFSRLISHAQEVLFCPEARIYYRSGLSSSISGNQSKPAAISALKTIDLIKNYTLSLEDSSRARVSLANKYKDFAFAHYISYPDLAQMAEVKAKELGNTTVRLEGGIVLRSLESMFGWKLALRIKATLNGLFRRYGDK